MLHWLVAVAILLMIPAGLMMVRDGLPRPVQDALFLFHKNVGAALIVVITFRILWRISHPAPPLPRDMPDWQHKVAGLSHGLLYVFMVVMPISGYVRVRAGGFPIEALDAIGLPTLIPRNKALADTASWLHEIAGWGLMAILALHIGAALYHALVRHDGVWDRMWPRGPRT
jgi:cytochrome b561